MKKINQNKMAKAIAEAEGGHQSLSIAQIKEVQRLTLAYLSAQDRDDNIAGVVDLIYRHPCEPKFAVGDWVRIVGTNETCRVAEIDSRPSFFLHRLDGSHWGWHADYGLTRWEPREGEWVKHNGSRHRFVEPYKEGAIIERPDASKRVWTEDPLIPSLPPAPKPERYLWSSTVFGAGFSISIRRVFTTPDPFPLCSYNCTSFEMAQSILKEKIEVHGYRISSAATLEEFDAEQIKDMIREGRDRL